jgi:GNAT superfamily N-acetyltransferase
MWVELRRVSPDELARGDRIYRRWMRRERRRRRFVAFVVETVGGSAASAAASGALWLQDQEPRPGIPEGPFPYLMSMYTEPEHRGHGHASEVVRAAVAWARERRFARVVLHAAPMGRRIYRDAGFRRGWEMRLELVPRPPWRRPARRRRT